MNDIHSILIVEDDTAISFGLKDAFEEEMYAVTVAKDGAEGLAIARNRPFHCIILDIMLPTMNGREVCKALRKDGITGPILMLTSKSAESDVILGLELGADDYMTKPFRLRELLARVRALIRRVQKPEAPPKIEKDEYPIGNVKIDFIRGELVTFEKREQLLIRELEILQYFRAHEGKVITREDFLNELWGYDQFPTTRTIDNYILGLRKKIEVDPAQPKHFITVRNLGYKFIQNA
ncbi:MAG: response regulator transcription factor [Candidatus Kapaibacterium sp.]